MTPVEKHERAQKADQLLKNKLFQEIMHTAHSRWVEKLQAIRVGDLTALEAHAMIKAYSEMQQDLQSIITDEKFLTR